MKDLVIVTGASRGIGRAAVREFIRRGCQVLAVARTEEDLRSLQKECGCLIRRADVSEESEVRSLFAFVKDSLLPEVSSAEYTGTHGHASAMPLSDSARFRLRALVNNAGISIIGLLQDMTLAEWNRIFQTNVTSAFLTCREAIPLFLREGSGSIVNVSSVWGSAGASCESAYSATKGAVNAFTKALARELAPSNIRVNAAAFGCIDTDMNHFLSPEDRKDLEAEIGMGRFGTPEEAAGLIADLALNNPYLTGQIVTMDGAWI